MVSAPQLQRAAFDRGRPPLWPPWKALRARLMARAVLDGRLCLPIRFPYQYEYLDCVRQPVADLSMNRFGDKSAICCGLRFRIELLKQIAALF